MKKLLHTEPSKAPRYLVGVLGWLKEGHFAKVKRAILNRLKGRSLLLLAWVGPDMCHATKLEVIVACDGNIYTRRATAEPDKDKYWYAYFDGGWENATR
jgi:exosome complex RNA-binding protein Rrp4